MHFKIHHKKYNNLSSLMRSEMKTSLLSLKSLSQRTRRRWEINLRNKVNQQHLLQHHLSRLSSPRRLLSVNREWIFMRQTKSNQEQAFS
jgi:hypothetical protein